MARYVTLIRFTEKGAQAIKESPARAEAFRKAADKAGISVETQLWTAGAYDGILICSGDDEQKLLAALAKLVAQGYVHTQTMQAFDNTEFRKILGR